MFNSGTVTEDLDSSSSEESDIEYLLTSDDEETSSHSSLVNDQRVSFHVSLFLGEASHHPFASSLDSHITNQ